MFRSNRSRSLSFVCDTSTFFVFFATLYVAFAAPSEEWLKVSNHLLSLFLALALGSILVEVFSNLLRLETLGQILVSRHSSGGQKFRVAGFWKWQLFLFIGVMTYSGVKLSQVSLRELVEWDGLQSALQLFSQLASPDWALLPTATLKVIETLFIAFLATLFSVPLAFLIAFFCAKNLMKTRLQFTIYASLRTVLNIIRSVEPIIWAIIFSVWVGIGPFAGMLALMVQSVASLAKQYSELIEEALPGPIEGVAATGANQIQIIWFGILPQVLLPYVSFTIYRWDINVRMATIIGLAGGGGIGTLLYQYSMRALWPQVGCLILVIAFVVWIMDMTSAYLRQALKEPSSRQ